MSSLIRRSSLLCMLVLLTQPGCKKLNDDRFVEVEPGEEKLIIADPASRDQSVTVSWDSEGAPVNVYLYLEKDQKAASDAIALGKNSDKVLASKKLSNEDTLQVQVPSGEKLVVMMTSRKQAKVRVKMVGN
jgi:predicted glutamine amidotransferase